MPELFGPLPRHVVADLPLIAAVLAPWAAGAIVAVGGDALEERRLLRGLAERVGAPRVAGLVAAVGCALSAVVLLVGAVRAAGASPALLVSPAWVMARVGSIDAVLGFDLDLPRALVALAAALLGVVHACRRGGRDARSAATTAAIVGGAVAAVAADGFATALLALGVTMASTSFAARGARWACAASAMGLVLLAGTTLAWSLEGRWLDGIAGNYLSDYGVRFAAVRDAAAPSTRPRGAAAAEGRGALTMTSTPGAEVFTGVSDESSMRARRTPLGTSPFVGAAVPAVLHKIAIIPGAAAVVGGDGLEIALLDAVDVRAGDDLVLQPVGATTTWRDLDAQLSLKDADAKHPLLSALSAKAISGIPAATVVLGFLFAAALLVLCDLPRRVARAFTGGGRLEAALVAGALAAAAIAPVARGGRLVPLAGAVALLAIAAALAAVGVIALRASGIWRAGGGAAIACAAALVVVTGDGAALAIPLAAVAAAVAAWLLAREGGTTPPVWLLGDDDAVTETPHARTVAAGVAPRAVRTRRAAPVGVATAPAVAAEPPPAPEPAVAAIAAPRRKKSGKASKPKGTRS